MMTFERVKGWVCAAFLGVEKWVHSLAFVGDLHMGLTSRQAVTCAILRVDTLDR